MLPDLVSHRRRWSMSEHILPLAIGAVVAAVVLVSLLIGDQLWWRRQRRKQAEGVSDSIARTRRGLEREARRDGSRMMGELEDHQGERTHG
jgi:hypothetical protein